MWEEVYGEAEHDPVPVEKSFGIDREGFMADGIRGRCRGSKATNALEEVFGVREITIRTWLCRSGMQGKKLHEWFMVELELVHGQLDEAFATQKLGERQRWQLGYVAAGDQRRKNKAGAGGA